MTPQELTELEHAQKLPAWTMLKVRDPVVGWRAFSAHEIRVLAEMFEIVREEVSGVYLEVGRTLGLIVEEDKND